ncbi:hypothetical protein [Pseudonocardia sp.]|uniref:hypothetical protein n=1 Tax=Pseudonocardia sp. TaxID=60912 RepID=UPI003D14EA91
MTGFTVDPAALDAHAAVVAELASVLAATADAARPLDAGAYGVIGQAFAGWAMAAAARADRAVGALGDRLASHPSGVRATAAAYRRVEDGVVERLRDAT